MDVQQLFFGPNAGYALELYEQYLADPASVDEQTARLFAHVDPSSLDETQPTGRPTPQQSARPVNGTINVKAAAIANLANAIRDYGHLAAQLDPLGSPPPGDPLLRLVTHALTEADLTQLSAKVVANSGVESSATAADAIARLRAVYSSSIGYDIAHIHNPEERAWLRNSAETHRYHPSNTPLDEKALLERLTQVEGFEQYLHNTFQGKKRFSIEGLDVMVPMLDEILADAAQQEISSVLIGMAHRGRLNVLTHVMQKPYAEMLAEFKDIYSGTETVNYTGDVKYHFGYTRNIGSLTVQMADNPSHLELVNPVVEGMARAAGSKTDLGGEVRMDPLAVMPILIHGDAAFAGQGIVPETLNLSRLPGWRVGGTIHFIANNQIGFTTDYRESRSTLYASDIAKGFEIPVIHVNADDVEACIEVARLAMAYQTKFEKDILIDLIGYRRYGHNEGDEPRMTQPAMYASVDQHPTVWRLWANELEQRGTVASGEADRLMQAQFDHLAKVYAGMDKTEKQLASFVHDRSLYRNWETQVDADQLVAYNNELLKLPPAFQLHRGLKRVMGRRATALDTLDEATIDWGHAESLAFASILAEGTPIRLTGEDAERGTFSHRHAIVRNMTDGSRHAALQVLPQSRASFECRNSALSENAAIGFEYGYTLQKPNSLVLWEGQFGDFVNGAQPIIDEYITSGRAKWSHKAPLVMLLPHGYEGQGPDHSTARLERFLQMAADRNMRIVNPTTAAQYFHLLRRHQLHLQADPRPLIVMTPKSLLRHPMARSSLRELSEGGFQPIIDDPSVTPQKRRHIKRIVLCSGKVYVDAVTSSLRPENPDVAFVRVEQLYRFPLQQIKTLLASYKGCQSVVWMQEEPKNGGSWYYVRSMLARVVGDLPFGYIGRPHRASPAEGALHWHRVNQDEIIRQAYEIE
ncbi:MAG: 2-oxoglutarate dehydrogenase E1 component [Candidatus Promineifilaceae bacterium]